MRAATIALALMLAGCGGLQTVDGGVQVNTSVVGVPVGRPCFVDGDLPVLPSISIVDEEHATSDQLAAANAANAESFVPYGIAADKLLRKCVKSTTWNSNVQTAPLKPDSPAAPVQHWWTRN